MAKQGVSLGTCPKCVLHPATTRCVRCNTPVCGRRYCSNSVASFIKRYSITGLTARKGCLCKTCQIAVRREHGQSVD